METEKVLILVWLRNYNRTLVVDEAEIIDPGSWAYLCANKLNQEVKENIFTSYRGNQWIFEFNLWLLDDEISSKEGALVLDAFKGLRPKKKMTLIENQLKKWV